MSKEIFACFAGYGKQYWLNLQEPNINGCCDRVTVCKVDAETGRMTKVSEVTGLDSPATLVVSPDQKFLYAANELNCFKGQGYGGGITALSLDSDTGSIKLINQSLACGSCTAYITVDKTGKYILVANHGSFYFCSRYTVGEDGTITPNVMYDEGCVSLFEVREDGGVGRLLDRVVLEGTGADSLMHASSHPHAVIIDEQDFVIIPNKGGDNVYVCRLNREKGKLETLSVYKTEYGSSPRHAAFVPGTDFVLVQNEYDGHLCSYSIDRSTGKLTRISRIDNMDPSVHHVNPLITKQHPWGLDVQVHPNGRFIYTNNSQNVISLFLIDRETGELSLKKQFHVEDVAMMTRGMQIDRDGTLLAVTCVVDEKVLMYRIDAENGELTLLSETALPTPTALRFIYPEK